MATPSLSLVFAIWRMSIRARAAFGLICVERAVTQLRLDSEPLRECLQSLWRCTEAENLEFWNCRLEAEDLAELCDSVQAERLEVLAHMFAELDEIGGGNLYGGFRNGFTQTPTQNLAVLLVEHNVLLPPAGPFIRLSPRRLWNPWGRSFKQSDLRAALEGAE